MTIKYPIDIYLNGEEHEQEAFLAQLSSTQFKDIFLTERVFDSGKIQLTSATSTVTIDSHHDITYLTTKNNFKFCLHFGMHDEKHFANKKNAHRLVLHEGLASLGNGTKYQYKTEDDLRDLLETIDPPRNLTVLILAGGESRRMGENKSKISYRSKPQYQYLIDICTKLELPYYISMRTGQEAQYDVNPKHIIYDRYENFPSPLNGILSAMEKTDSALLVIATDLPFIETQDIERLIKLRDPLYYATAHYNEATNFPDPLFTILEPITYNLYLQYKNAGYLCPRKMLINAPTNVIMPRSPEILVNANKQEDKKEAMEKIKPE